ncbi:hypothetical protein ACLUXJ_10070, partial [Lactobacillus porci]
MLVEFIRGLAQAIDQISRFIANRRDGKGNLGEGLEALPSQRQRIWIRLALPVISSIAACEPLTQGMSAASSSDICLLLSFFSVTNAISFQFWFSINSCVNSKKIDNKKEGLSLTMLITTKTWGALLTMNYTEQTVFTQDFEANKGVLFFESGLTDFIQVGMPIQNDDEKIFVGKLAECEPGFCPDCSAKLVKNGTLVTTLKHVPLGIEHTKIKVSYAHFRCLNTDCKFNTRSQPISFKADGYRITKALKECTEHLLSDGYTLKQVAALTGLDKMTVKSIHKELLLSKFTTDGKTLIKPERQARYLAIDEFKLHDGYKYATVIIDWETGHILYLA